jgi:hypothetical protein
MVATGEEVLVDRPSLEAVTAAALGPLKEEQLSSVVQPFPKVGGRMHDQSFGVS